MDDSTLTNDAKYLLTISYKNYLLQIKSGKSKKFARYLDDIKSIKVNLLPEFSLQDISDIVKELKSNGFIEYKQYMNPFPTHIELTTKSISYGEQKFKRNVKSVIDAATSLKSLLF